MSIDLVKAIWASGFRAGYDSGMDSATCFEWGTHSGKPQDADSAWKADVQWCIDTEHSSHLDINDPKSWENVP